MPAGARLPSQEGARRREAQESGAACRTPPGCQHLTLSLCQRWPDGQPCPTMLTNTALRLPPAQVSLTTQFRVALFLRAPDPDATPLVLPGGTEPPRNPGGQYVNQQQQNCGDGHTGLRLT